MRLGHPPDHDHYTKVALTNECIYVLELKSLEAQTAEGPAVHVNVHWAPERHAWSQWSTWPWLSTYVLALMLQKMQFTSNISAYQYWPRNYLRILCPILRGKISLRRISRQAVCDDFRNSIYFRGLYPTFALTRPRQRSIIWKCTNFSFGNLIALFLSFPELEIFSLIKARERIQGVLWPWSEIYTLKSSNVRFNLFLWEIEWI